MAVLKSLLIGVVLLSLTGDASSSASYSGRGEGLIQLDIFPLIETATGLYRHSSEGVDPTLFLPLLETVNFDYLKNVDIKDFANFFTLNMQEAEIIRNFFIKFHERWENYQAKELVKKILLSIPKLVQKVGGKWLFNELKLLQAVSHPLGYAADAAQLILELAGYDIAGAMVGCVGNGVAGAISGFAIGGPPGALVGGALGVAVWYVGEMASASEVNYAYADRTMKVIEFVT